MPDTCRNYWWSICQCWVSTSVGSLGMHCILVWLISTSATDHVQNPGPKKASNMLPLPLFNIQILIVVIATPSLPIPWYQTRQESSRGPVSMPVWRATLSHRCLIWSGGEFEGSFSALSCSCHSLTALAGRQDGSFCWWALYCEGWFCNSVWVGDASVWTSTQRQLLHFWTLYCCSCGSSPDLIYDCFVKRNSSLERKLTTVWVEFFYELIN